MHEIKGKKQIEPLLLNSGDAARLCGCSVKSWRWRVEYGYTPKPIKIGRRNVWRTEELYAWVAESCPKREDWQWEPSKRLRK